jgi:hypothetical protein
MVGNWVVTQRLPMLLTGDFTDTGAAHVGDLHVYRLAPMDSSAPADEPRGETSSTPGVQTLRDDRR